MTKYDDEPYRNEYQKEAVEFLHTRKEHTAVVSCGNSTIDVYLTRGIFSRINHELGPYDIDKVIPLPDDSEFACKVTMSADWSDVDTKGPE